MRVILAPHLHWVLQSISSRMMTLGVVLTIDGMVLTILAVVSITDGSVDWTESSVHMILGALGLSWSSKTPTWRAKSLIVKSKLGSYRGSGVPGRI